MAKRRFTKKGRKKKKIRKSRGKRVHSNKSAWRKMRTESEWVRVPSITASINGAGLAQVTSLGQNSSADYVCSFQPSIADLGFTPIMAGLYDMWKFEKVRIKFCPRLSGSTYQSNPVTNAFLNPTREVITYVDYDGAASSSYEAAANRANKVTHGICKKFSLWWTPHIGMPLYNNFPLNYTTSTSQALVKAASWMTSPSLMTSTNINFFGGAFCVPAAPAGTSSNTQTWDLEIYYKIKYKNRYTA